MKSPTTCPRRAKAIRRAKVPIPKATRETESGEKQEVAQATAS